MVNPTNFTDFNKVVFLLRGSIIPELQNRVKKPSYAL